MGIVHERPGSWAVVEPDTALRTIGPSIPMDDDDGRSPSDGRPMVVVSVRVRPMGPNSRFVARGVADSCLNCGEWIHPGTPSWYDPDIDEALCATCWPAQVVATSRRGEPDGEAIRLPECSWV